MIVKMKFLSITGPKDDIERMAGQYLSRYEFQLENALTELKTVRDLRAYTDKNPYEEIIRQAKEYLPAGLKTDQEFPDITAEQAANILREAERHLTELRNKRAELSEGVTEMGCTVFKNCTSLKIFAGRAINPAHQNPGLPADLSIKMQLLDTLCGLVERLGKRVEKTYY